LLNQSQGIDQWSDDSAYSWHDHTYQSVHGQQTPRHHQTAVQQQPIYHSLDSEPTGNQFDSGAAAGGAALGSLDVMLPNGQMVAATLMRNNNGKIVPVVQVPNTPTSRSTGSKPVQPASSSTTTSSTSTTSVSPPPYLHQQDLQPATTMHSAVTFPKTIVYKNDMVPTTAAASSGAGSNSSTQSPKLTNYNVDQGQQQRSAQGQFGSFISNSGFTNPNNRHQVIQHNSPSKRGGGGNGYLV